MEQKEIFDLNNKEFSKPEWVDIILQLSERIKKNKLRRQENA